jgi:hypothetical protein
MALTQAGKEAFSGGGWMADNRLILRAFSLLL